MREPDLTGDVTDSPALAWASSAPAIAGGWARSSATPWSRQRRSRRPTGSLAGDPPDPQVRVWQL